eukprot:TRINITY_DN68136_c1_g5_i1.p1 TRINITY_DN68136_c1_g5~~TRINITY_DN68136_c1_g5_i1.p1  ORF type:complete len:354 (-),score=28.68 TRINITY_DN68136_c1_g5_i1:211-1272(-)
MSSPTKGRKKPIRPNPLALDRFLVSRGSDPIASTPYSGPQSKSPPQQQSGAMKLAMFSTTKYVDERRGDFKQFRPAIQPPNVLENTSNTPGALCPSPPKPPSPAKTMRTAAEIWKDGMFEGPTEVTDLSRSNEHRDRLRLAPVTLKGGRVVQQKFECDQNPVSSEPQLFLMLPSQRRKAFKRELQVNQARQTLAAARRAENKLNTIIHHQYPNGFLGGETTTSEGSTLYSEKSEQNRRTQQRMVELAERRKQWIELNENKPGSGGKTVLHHNSSSTQSPPADQKGTSGGFKFLQSKVRCAPQDNFTLGSMVDIVGPQAVPQRRKQMLVYCDTRDRDFNILSGEALQPAASPYA